MQRLVMAAAVFYGMGFAALETRASAVTTLDGSQDWYGGTRNSGTVAITTSNPRSGDGSLEMTSTGSPDKAWATFGTGSPLGTLQQLITNQAKIAFDIYRDGSSTNAAYQFPTFKLYVKNSSGETASLIWESVYNGYPTTSPLSSDTWHSLDITGDYFWMWNSGAVTKYDLTLSDWAAGGTYTAGGTTSIELGNDTEITGIEVGIGSGWAGTFTGYVDNVDVTFDDGAIYTANFEVTAAVPEPSTLAMGGVAVLLSLGATWRHRRRKAGAATA